MSEIEVGRKEKRGGPSASGASSWLSDSPFETTEWAGTNPTKEGWGMGMHGLGGIGEDGKRQKRQQPHSWPRGYPSSDWVGTVSYWYNKHLSHGEEYWLGPW